MAGFSYKFESILKLKIQIEDNLKNELGVAKRALLNQEEKLNNLNNKLQDTYKSMREESSLITIHKLKEFSGFIAHLKNKINIQINNVNQEKEKVDIIKGRVNEAMKERKMFEKLKEKNYEEYIKDEFKKEQLQTDEMINFKQNNKTKDGG